MGRTEVLYLWGDGSQGSVRPRGRMLLPSCVVGDVRKRGGVVPAWWWWVLLGCVGMCSKGREEGQAGVRRVPCIQLLVFCCVPSTFYLTLQAPAPSPRDRLALQASLVKVSKQEAAAAAAAGCIPASVQSSALIIQCRRLLASSVLSDCLTCVH